MLEIYEILDRFEILFPNNSKIADLRRLYVDKDLPSLFRLIGNKKLTGESEDFRKAIVEKNLHSIFRIINDDELRKLILEDNIWKTWPILERYTSTQLISALKSLLVHNINFDKDSLSQGQLKSKIWLIQELKKTKVELGTVFLCAGWYGILSILLFESGLKIDKIRNFDIDSNTVDIAEIFNKPWFIDQWKYKSLVYDIMDVNYDKFTWQCWSNKNNRMSYPITDSPNTIINTSCEHLIDFTGWYNKIPIGKLVILQANNFDEVNEHINTYNSLNDFTANIPMTHTLFQGELNLQKYKRFMKIGFK